MIGGIILSAFAAYMLARLLRADLRRLLRPIVVVEAEVIENVRHTGFLYWEGPTARYRFDHEGKTYEVDRTFQAPAVIGSTGSLTFAQGFPQDARDRQVVARSFTYVVLLGLLAYGAGLMMGWL